jgi:hypothetical protein
MKEESEVNKNIAHIQHDGKFFQVLNEEGTDWDEVATRQAYDAYLATLQ